MLEDDGERGGTISHESTEEPDGVALTAGAGITGTSADDGAVMAVESVAAGEFAGLLVEIGSSIEDKDNDATYSEDGAESKIGASV